MDRAKRALDRAVAELLAERNDEGYWEGELSSSALATATAIAAIAIARRHGSLAHPPELDLDKILASGLTWLSTHQNADGGWGDTTRSLSNISTTALCWAAFGAASADAKYPETVLKSGGWLEQRIGASLTEPRASAALADAILARYGSDRTFSVPILTLCALAGRLGSGRGAWKRVIPLPFELAAFPHQFFAALRLPVVSYALPALIAMGQARHCHAPSANPIIRGMRHLARARTLRVLTQIQPENGGFLEATPLTSFVTMSLAASGQIEHAVTRRGLDFLLRSQRKDGSWPIDTNLSTWCTTLAIDALPGEMMTEQGGVVEWLLSQQYRVEHPYTHAAPGGWAWTDLPGGVPDADDTSGALIALAKLRGVDQGRREEVAGAVRAGLRWLIALQNRDGGIPTFCRGWGALPFDRSSADITAHAIRAWLAWHGAVDGELQRQLDRAIRRATEFLLAQEGGQGTWAPLWFGNQFARNEENLTYGTARVMRAFAALRDAGMNAWNPQRALLHGGEWLGHIQNRDGGWGCGNDTPSTVEETALAVEALAHALRGTRAAPKRAVEALERGVLWLCSTVEEGRWREPAPIGFYFAKLWYYEQLYPMIFTVGALRAALEFSEKGTG